MKLLMLIATCLMFASCASNQPTSQELDYCDRMCADKGLRFSKVLKEGRCECKEIPFREPIMRDRN